MTSDGTNDLQDHKSELVSLRATFDALLSQFSQSNTSDPEIDARLAAVEGKLALIGTKLAEAATAAAALGAGAPADDAAPMPEGSEGSSMPSGTVAKDAERAPPEDEDSADLQLSDMFGDFWAAVCEPSEGEIAEDAERAAIADQRAQLGALFATLGSDPDAWSNITESFSRLTNLVRTAQQIDAMSETHPGAATDARQAMAGFDAELGAGTEVTPELLAQLKADLIAADAQQATAEKHLAAAQAMPDGPAKDQAMAAAEREVADATADVETATNRQRAAKGKKMLTEAITTGPLSPIAPRPFSDQSASQFVEAFERAPDVASFAAEHAARSQNPDTIAGGMDMLCTNLENGFGDAEGRMPPDTFDGTEYATNLVRGAGAEGGEFFADASAYIQSGAHLQADPIPSPSGSSVNGRARDRANFVSDAAIDPHGTLNVQSEAAQAALGHLRFSPDVIDAPTPSLNAHVISTYEMLSDEDNQATAQGILDNTGTPTGRGQSLVAQSSGRPPGTVVDADDARQAVVTSLMTPVNQGPVGSCFSTAGVRRMSETQPLEAMQRYSEMAETGTFQPRNFGGGPPPRQLPAVPVPMSIRSDEDPLIRGMEYSAATVMAGMADNDRNEMLQRAVGHAVDGLIAPVGDDGVFSSSLGLDNWAVDKELIRAQLHASFRVEYDSTRQTAPSADGSSGAGVYLLIQTAPTSRIIDSEALFVAALTEVVLAAIGEPAGSDKAKEIAKTISSGDYLADLQSDGMAPWNMGGGGFPDEADEVLFGGDRDREYFDRGRTGWDNLFGVDQGGRTEDLLENLVGSFDGHDEEMMPIMNDGIHAFNALPNHPSLQALREGDVGDNIEEQLVAPGREIAQNDLPPALAEQAMAETLTRLRRWDTAASRQPLIDAAERTGLADQPAVPAAVYSAIVALFSAYLTQLALDIANNWQARELAAGRACDNAARDQYADSQRAVYAKTLEGFAMGGVASVTPLPSVTIADSNWGNAEKDIMLVMAPDPTTGDLIMWQQSLPSGEMTPMDETWVDAGWSEVVEDK